MNNEREIDFLTRLKISWNYLRGNFGSDMRVLSCGYCGGVSMKQIIEPDIAETPDKHQYLCVWKCRKCGAVCNEGQVWKLPEKNSTQDALK